MSREKLFIFLSLTKRRWKASRTERNRAEQSRAVEWSGDCCGVVRTDANRNNRVTGGRIIDGSREERDEGLQQKTGLARE